MMRTLRTAAFIALACFTVAGTVACKDQRAGGDGGATTPSTSGSTTMPKTTPSSTAPSMAPSDTGTK